MPKSYFNVSGGEYLTQIGASWFVSYLYFLKIDKVHLNWNKVSTVILRTKRFNKHSRFHKEWIQLIVNMEPKRLARNKIGLSGNDVVAMAKVLLPLFSTP